MATNQFLKAGMLTIIVVILFVAFWEGFWRSKGFPISYNDDEALWADKRAMVYEPINQATVFIGSSRIKFDLDVPHWERKTRDHAIQLAMVASCPRPVLEDLANDINFRGKLIIDVTEAPFFSRPGPRFDIPLQNVAYYKKVTPAQKASFILNHGLESQFVFLQKNTFSINAFLDRLPIHERVPPSNLTKFPMKWSFVDFDRQTKMGNDMLTDTSMQWVVKRIWMPGFNVPPMRYDSIEEIMKKTKVLTDKIKQRGGQVIFVRTPSSGIYLETERKLYPRGKYWDRLLAVTQCPGIHFEDYPEISHIQCPEWSHLGGKDRILFTNWLISALLEKGWKFTHGPIASR